MRRLISFSDCECNRFSPNWNLCHKRYGGGERVVCVAREYNYKYRVIAVIYFRYRHASSVTQRKRNLSELRAARNIYTLVFIISKRKRFFKRDTKCQKWSKMNNWDCQTKTKHIPKRYTEKLKNILGNITVRLKCGGISWRSVQTLWTSLNPQISRTKADESSGGKEPAARSVHLSSLLLAGPNLIHLRAPRKSRPAILARLSLKRDSFENFENDTSVIHKTVPRFPLRHDRSCFLTKWESNIRFTVYISNVFVTFFFLFCFWSTHFFAATMRCAVRSWVTSSLLKD